MKELDIIFSSLSRRLGIADDSGGLLALDVAKIEVLGLLMHLQAAEAATRPDSIVRVRRGGGNGGN